MIYPVHARAGRGRSASVILLVVGLAIAGRVGLPLWLPMAPLAEIAVNGDGDTRYYVRLAQHLESRGEYAQGHLRAYMPPGYPAFLSGLLKLGGDARTIQMVQNLLYVIAVLMLGVLASRQGGPLTGALAATLALASPIWWLLPQRALSETLFVVLVAIGISVTMSGGAPPAFGLALLGGIVFGLAALVREMGVLMGGMLAVVVGVWAWREGSRARAVAIAATVLLGIAVAVMPWTARNYSVLGQIVPISTNGPINLYIGNNPEATGAYVWHLPPEGQAVWNRPDQGRSNELFTSGQAGREALAYILANPGRTLALVPYKLWALWGPPVALHSGFGVGALARSGAAVLWFACLALGTAGLWQLRREPIAWFIAGVCLIATLIHGLTFGDPRFRAPYEYLLMLPAGFSLAEIWAWRAR
jgi:4-amino-4-deoxy-L-arabinose transferase-like glycosyltransferase